GACFGGANRNGDVTVVARARTVASIHERRAAARARGAQENEMTNIARPVGEEDLQGWVDGRLTPERQEAVRDYLTRHPEERGRLSQYGEQKRALRAAFRGPTEPIPARLQGAWLIASSRRRQRHHLIQFAAAILLLVVGGLAGWLGGAIG